MSKTKYYMVLLTEKFNNQEFTQFVIFKIEDKKNIPDKLKQIFENWYDDDTEKLGDLHYYFPDIGSEINFEKIIEISKKMYSELWA